MKKQKIVGFLVVGMLLSSGFPVSVSAMDGMGGFDMMNNMNMDMMLEQSYHTMDSVEFANDMAMDNNDLNHSMNEMLFFPDLLDVINTTNNTPQSVDQHTLFPETIVAVNDGAWMPEFNNFFNQPTAEIPMDIEMSHMDLSNQTVPVFQSGPQDTIGDLQDSSGMDNNHSSDLDNTSDVQFGSEEGNNTDPEFGGDASYTDDPGVRGEVDFIQAPDTSLTDLEMNVAQPPEEALVDVAQPDIHTEMVNALDGEMTHLPEENPSMEDNGINDNNNFNPDEPSLESPKDNSSSTNDTPAKVQGPPPKTE